MTITNGGTLTFGSGGDLILDGVFSQDGTGTVSTAGDITTTNDNITFDQAITLTGNVVLDSGAAAGNVTFNAAIDGANDVLLTLI